MPPIFRSTAGLAARRRSRPSVERATFVIAAAGRWRVALPVEWVERVVRYDGGHTALTHNGVLVPVRNLAALLDVDSTAADEDARVLIARVTATDGHAHDQSRYVGWHVDRVFEVFAVETALVQPRTAASGPAPAHHAARGMFPRMEHVVWIVDPARLEGAS